MTEQEWLTSDDPIAMLEALRANWHGEKDGLVKLTHRYLLASCRAIWTLLPLEASRKGVEAASRYIEGRATLEEYALAEWQSEGAAFFLDPHGGPLSEEKPDEPAWLREIREEARRTREEWPPEVTESEQRYQEERKARIETLVKEIEAIPIEEMRQIVRISPDAVSITPRQLLADAAYFANFAMIDPGFRPTERGIESHSQFLPAPLLRDFVGTPYQGDWQKQWYNRRPCYRL